MGSTFVKSEQATMFNGSGTKNLVPLYMQFVPGNVVASVTSLSHPFAKGDDG